MQDIKLIISLVNCFPSADTETNIFNYTFYFQIKRLISGIVEVFKSVFDIASV